MDYCAPLIWSLGEVPAQICWPSVERLSSHLSGLQAGAGAPGTWNPGHKGRSFWSPLWWQEGEAPGRRRGVDGIESFFGVARPGSVHL